LCFLAASIYPQNFDYIAREPVLLDYARRLIRVEHLADGQTHEPPTSPLVTLKTEIARQYAQAADHNRQINKRRERRRSVAGLAALGSVLVTVFLVATAYAHYLSRQSDKGPSHASAQSVPLSDAPGSAWPDAGGQVIRPNGAGTTPDAGRH
jgi:hypothetical protein